MHSLVVTVETNPARLKAIVGTAITLVALSAFSVLVFSVQAPGQSTTPPAIGPASRTVNLTAEQEFIIREIVLKDLNVSKAKPEAPETIGDAVPENIELQPIPPEVAAKVLQAEILRVLRQRRQDKTPQSERSDRTHRLRSIKVRNEQGQVLWA